MSLIMYSHFHKQFPFNFNSSWMRAVYTGGREEQINPPDPYSPYIDINKSGDTINSFRHYFPNLTENQFLTMMGFLATEYFLWKQHSNDVDFIGCGSYRRYLFLKRNGPLNQNVIFSEINNETCQFLSDDESKENALNILQSADVICNHNTILSNTVEEQYLEWEPPYYWHLFKQAIYDLYPDYRKHLSWFTTCTVVHFETSYIMRKEYFLKYAEELFTIIKYVIEHADEKYPLKKPTDTFRELLPWRYPGFLGERFMPFFTYANSMKKHQVPLVFLGQR